MRNKEGRSSTYALLYVEENRPTFEYKENA